MVYSKKVSSSATFWSALTRRKPVAKSISQTSSQKTLGWFDLTAYGIAATVGSGIYVTAGRVAKDLAGPAVVISTLIAGLLSLFTGICYLEFASSLPISGSGYAYFYTMVGEFLGWFIGWNLTLEYSFAAAAIAGGWTEYLVTLIRQLGWKIPDALFNIPIWGAVRINFIAGIVVFLIGFIVSRGLKFGALITNVITVTNLGIILFIIGVGSFSVEPSNWKPFVPFGWGGVFQGAGKMFFSYIGYDTISSLAGDAINPSRDLPIAVLLTVLTATLLYMGVGFVLTGMQNYVVLADSSPLASAFVQIGKPWASHIVSIVALFTMGATMFACLMGQPKIFQAIAKDGLLPPILGRENSQGTAVGGVVFTTLLTAVLATFLDVDLGLIDMVSFGTLLGMSMLCAALLVVRFEQHPPSKKSGTSLTILYFLGTAAASTAYNLGNSMATYACIGITSLFFVGLCYLFVRYGRDLESTSLAFSCPLMPIVPCIAIAANTFMMLQMGNMLLSLTQFVVWSSIGFVIYFLYGINHSHLLFDEEN